MSDKPIEVAHHLGAPEDERRQALSEAQKTAMPSSVKDMGPLIQFMQEQYQDQSFAKSMMKQSAIPLMSQSLASRNGDNGMQSVYLDERRIQNLGQYYEPPGMFAFDMMKTMVDQTPVLSSVILTRQRQIKRFCRTQDSGKGPGFAIRTKDHNAKLGAEEANSIQMLESFFTNCGWENRPRHRMRLKRDNFSGLMTKLVRDSLIMDSAAIETEWKRDKALGLDGMYAVDGSTIRLCTEEGYQGDDEIFALQVVQGNLRSAYTYDDLIYVPRNQRSDVMVGGYGMSETELLVKVVTGFLNAMTYNLKYFDDNTIPKGILHLAGDYGEDDLNSFKRYWNAMIKGVNNSWTLPVMVSKNGESKASYEKFGADVDEIMFSKWMTFLTSIICAIYGMAPDEINFESFTAGTSTLSGSDTEEKLINSKDKGLRPLLAHFEDVFSDYVVSEFGDKYVFRWTGLDEQTAEQAWTEETALNTLNESRKMRGLEELDWGDVPLNQNLIAAYMQSIEPEEEEDYGNEEDSDQPDNFAVGEEDEDANLEGAEDPEGAEQEQEQEQDLDKNPEDDDEDDMQKSFGLPVFRVDP